MKLGDLYNETMFVSGLGIVSAVILRPFLKDFAGNVSQNWSSEIASAGLFGTGLILNEMGGNYRKVGYTIGGTGVAMGLYSIYRRFMTGSGNGGNGEDGENEIGIPEMPGEYI